MLKKNELKKRKWFINALASHEHSLEYILWAVNETPNIYNKFYAIYPVEAEYAAEDFLNGHVNITAGREDAELVIRAAFELGYIEQAMTCQRILDAIPDE